MKGFNDFFVILPNLPQMLKQTNKNYNNFSPMIYIQEVHTSRDFHSLYMQISDLNQFRSSGQIVHRSPDHWTK